MRKKIQTLALGILLALPGLRAQDTISIMHYNLLNYGVSTSYCTPANNDMSAKEAAWREVFAYMAPDLLTVNEINPYWAYHKRFVDSTFAVLYPAMYAYKSGTNSSGDIHSNGLFYRKDRLALARHQSIPTAVRDFDAYTMYYKDPLLPQTNDTAFFTIIAGHFKAGSTASDESDRLLMAQLLTAFMDTFSMPGPVMLAGDYNMKGSTEAAYQALITGINPDRRFTDPIGSPGSWYNNSSFSAIHTQSTQTTSAGCASTGGLDDRFDIILSTPSLISGNTHYQYIPGSYKAIGNDGQHFNQPINAGTNNAVPVNVANALHFASDHLPVLLKMRVDQSGAGIDDPRIPGRIGSIYQDQGKISISLLSPQVAMVQLLDVNGRMLISQQIADGTNTVSLDVSHLSPGLYMIVLQAKGRTPETRKIILTR